MAGDAGAPTSYVDVDPAALRDAEALRALLGAHGVATAAWGAGTSKSVEDLLEEIRQRETRLVLLPPPPAGGGPPALLRLLTTLNVFVSAAGAPDGRVLCEECQTLPDGRQRRRGLPLSEKMIAGEGWRDALRRAVAEELGTALPDAGNPQARAQARAPAALFPCPPPLLLPLSIAPRSSRPTQVARSLHCTRHRPRPNPSPLLPPSSRSPSMRPPTKRSSKK